MKTIGYILCTLLLFNTSCSKESEASGSYVGKWNWVRTDGGIAFNIHDTPASTGRHVVLQLTAQNYYYLSVDGVVKEKGPFTVRMVNSIYGKELKMLDFYPGMQWVVYDVKPTTLELSDNCADGVSSAYERIK